MNFSACTVIHELWYRKSPQYAVHIIPYALQHFGTAYQTRVLDLSILAWRIGHGPLNQTQCFYGRKKKEEMEIRDAEQAKVKFFIQTIQTRGSSCLTARHYILLIMTSPRSKHRQMHRQFHH
jgi:hypothetical protein